MSYENILAEFRQRIRSRSRLLGTFVKSTVSANVEILASEGFDFLVIDAEHSPLGRAEVDNLSLAARASAIPALVRVPDSSASSLLSTLDGGAAGVVVPHVSSREIAIRVGLSCKYRPGGRGFSAATRSAGYGSRKMADVIAKSNDAATVIVQIEDEEALRDLGGILSIDDVDGALIGRADLAVSLGEASPGSQRVMDAVKDICRACAEANKAAIVFAASVQEAQTLFEIGATAAVIGSDQAYLRKAAREIVSDLGKQAGAQADRASGHSAAKEPGRES
jgi:2-keto-3-deoxy-L-rhamnonate aldolase RhmA